ncbi:MAG: hypothetical protein JWN74_759 [Acidobacteriaceae bacterium]|nr:hypothetical protein [Acidobacteriaceae bacterium]
MASKRRIIAIVTMGFGIILILGAAGYFWAIHDLNTAFAKADFGPLGIIFKKAAADVLVVKQPSKELSKSGGIVDLYRRNPAAFQADARLFDAWISAGQIGRSTLKSTLPGSWVRSTAEENYLSPDLRRDPWNHFVCLLRRNNILLVISGGPRAPISPMCRDIQVRESELAQLPRGRLLETPSGNLILVLDDKLSATTVPVR